METEIKNQVTSLKKALEKKEEEQEYIIKKRARLKDYKSDINSEIISKIIPFGITLCLASSLLAINTCFSTILKTSTAYDTIVNIYDSLSGYSLSKEEREYIKNGEETLVFEYEPWQKAGNHYTRDYIEYDVSNINYSDLAEFLLLDLDRFNIASSKETETKETLDAIDQYEGIKYVVVNSVQDKSSKHIIETPADSKKIVDFTKAMLALTFLSTIPIALSFELSSKYSFIDLKTRKQEIEVDMKRLLKKYQETNRDITKIKDELTNLYAKYGDLLVDSKKDCQRLLRGK